jgi:DNA-binding response OmpR family regulator
MARILVIEDDKDIAHLLALHLQDGGYEVATAHHGADGLNIIMAELFDLVVLDLMLPGIDGLELCRHIRERRPETLVLMLTAKSSELDRVLGLEIGADDYLTKPFSVREVQARVKALLRRKTKLAGSSLADVPKTIHAGDLLIKLETREVLVADKPVNLTAKEFDLLLQFAQHPGKVYTRTQLLDLVWGYGYDGFEHTVNSHINRLRAKIEADPADPSYIQTVWGVGYKFASFDR